MYRLLAGGLLVHRNGPARAEDTLGHADQLIGPVSHLLEPLQDLLNPVLQPVGRVRLRSRPVRTMAVAVRRPRRLGPRRARRARRLVGTAGISGWGTVIPGQFLGFVSSFLRPVGGFFRPVGVLLGSFGPGAGLFGGGASVVGPPHGLADRLLVAPFVGQFGRFLDQVSGFLGPIGGLGRAFGSLPRLLGQIPRILGDLPGPVRLLAGQGPGRGLGSGLFSLDAVRVLGCGVVRVLSRGVIPLIADVFGRVALVLHRVPGHAVGLTSLGHALAGGSLASLVLSHDCFFPGEAARVCSPW